MKGWQAGILLLCAPGWIGERQTQTVRCQGLYLDGAKPGVYHTEERRGPGQPKFSMESETGVWLRLHNNLRVPILLTAHTTREKVTIWARQDGVQFGSFKDDVQVEACYDTENIPQSLPREEMRKIP
jgi:hypothetical protein